jgi:CHU_C Type IX secretion signal domain
VFSCRNNNKSDSIAIPITNCYGLVNDTLGTNDNGRIYMPSAVTSNGDGKNDIIRPTTRNITSLTFTLYNSNNTVLFTSTQIGQGWTAHTLTTGTYSTYFYKIQAVTNSNRKIGICGDLNNVTCYPSNIPRNKIFFEDQLRIDGFTGITTETIANYP